MFYFGVSRCCCGELWRIYMWCECCGDENDSPGYKEPPEDFVPPEVMPDEADVSNYKPYTWCVDGKRMVYYTEVEFSSREAAEEYLKNHREEVEKKLMEKCNPFYIAGLCDCSQYDDGSEYGNDPTTEPCEYVCPTAEHDRPATCEGVHILRHTDLWEGCCDGCQMLVLSDPFFSESDAKTYLENHRAELEKKLYEVCGEKWYVVRFCECWPEFDSDGKLLNACGKENFVLPEGVENKGLGVYKAASLWNGCCEGYRVTYLSGPWLTQEDAEADLEKKRATYQASSETDCCRVPAYIELEIDYGGSAKPDEERSFWDSPVDCEDVYGRCRVSAGKVKVRLDYSGGQSCGGDFSYQGSPGDLVESAYYRPGNAFLGTEFSDHITLNMNFEPPLTPCVAETDSEGNVVWPEGFCMNTATTTYKREDGISATSFQFQLYRRSALKKECPDPNHYAMNCLSETATAPLFSQGRQAVTLSDWQTCGFSFVHVGASYGVCVNIDALNRFTPCGKRYEKTEEYALHGACFDYGICLGGYYFQTHLTANVVATATLYFKDEVE